MEGVGSTRLGRASARYGGSTAVFNGPVRKWKKKWVHLSPSSTAKHSQSGGQGSAASSVLLCRWTPLSLANSGSSVDGEDDEQPPKRKFRYTPVAVLEEERKKAEQSTDWLSSKTDIELKMNALLKKETQVAYHGFRKDIVKR
ncbi:Co-chaperone GrpE family protein, putative isoform 1 [Hibiscus syriacus]|uniref:Co-chaperone GrpE family protein, putative isoform 1 n=1 Tax=Hibiscus syriacus TaxID=106335 RepID=A0A6A3C894_HIBSY|nr:uncharacterized protein LOC120202399 [Hibiscus syriacus]KAE8725470.1 Co-chaperone GrpE family protein, putative isoform 1 [Hibiscus syriacus]